MGKKISDLNEIQELLPGDFLEVVRDGVNYKFTQKVDSLIVQQNFTTGSVVKFDKFNVYGTFTTPSTGNITHDLTVVKKELIQKIYHQNGIAPTVPASWVKLSGDYNTSKVNLIFALYAEGGRIEYWIIN